MPDNIIKYPTDYKTILDTLPRLKRDQLETIRSRAAFLLQGKAASKFDGVLESDWLLDGILFVLKERGIPTPKSFRIKNHSSFHGFQTKSEEMRESLEKALDYPNAVQLKSAGIIVARCLAQYIDKWSSVSFESMCNNIHKIPDAIDKSFPGYISAGLLPIILRPSK